MSLRFRLICLVLSAPLAVAACRPLDLTPVEGPAAPASATSPPAAPSPTPAVSPSPLPPTSTPAVTPLPTLPRTLATVPPTAAPVLGEVPADLMARLRADVEAQSGGPAASLELIRAEAMTWSDGSLGCPQPGMFYTQALEEGYWVVWRAPDGREYDYRLTQRGAFVLCPGPRPRPAGDLPATVTPLQP
ncbi:MAG: hypothetical protein JNK29_02685 [Anaerolineales bacterium]|nr:hypothetical protein [Anaerolineales bacterium]